MYLTSFNAMKILDSRGEPTISIVAGTKHGKVEASSPSGKSRGKNEAEPFSFKGIDYSISFANAIGRRLVSEKITFNYFEDLEKLEKIVREYDKTKNWSFIGGNTLLAMEYAILKSIAQSEKLELWKFLNPRAKKIPLPVGNCIGGGMHAKKDKKSDIQEFLLTPRTSNFYDAHFINLQAYKFAKHELISKDSSWKGELTDENAFASSLDITSTLNLLKEVSSKINEKYESKLDIGMDMAASNLWKEGNYNYKNPPSKKTTEEQINFLKELIEKYNLFYVEDPFHEDDFDSFASLVKNAKTLVVGDDLISTQLSRLQTAIEKKAINAVIIKPNQNGSLLETKKITELAQKNKITPIISHRSGETFDSSIADLAVAWNIPYIKSGILGKERFAKLNRLIKIEREI